MPTGSNLRSAGSCFCWPWSRLPSSLFFAARPPRNRARGSSHSPPVELRSCRVLAEARQSCPGSDYVSTFRGDGVAGRMSLPYSWRTTFQRFAATGSDRDVVACRGGPTFSAFGDDQLRRMPRWHAQFGIVAGVAQLFAVFFFPFFIWWAWIILASVLLVVRRAVASATVAQPAL